MGANRNTAPNGLDKYASRAGLKMLLLACIAAACLALIHFTGLKDYLTNIHALKNQLGLLGIWAPVVFTASVALLVALGAPRLLFCALGGMAFGFVQGLIWSQLGTIIGAFLTFSFARWGGRPWVSRKIAAFDNQTIRKLVHRPSVLSVFLIRQIPVGGFFINLFLGVTSITSTTFLIGSFLGFLPEAVVVTLIGSGLGKHSTAQGVIQIGIAVACAALVLFFALWQKKASKGTRQQSKKDN